MSGLWFALITLYLIILLVIEMAALGVAFLLSAILGISFSYVTVTITVAVLSAAYFTFVVIRGFPEIKKNLERYDSFRGL